MPARKRARRADRDLSSGEIPAALPGRRNHKRRRGANNDEAQTHIGSTGAGSHAHVLGHSLRAGAGLAGRLRPDDGSPSEHPDAAPGFSRPLGGRRLLHVRTTTQWPLGPAGRDLRSTRSRLFFWEDGETPICVSLRRKSGDPLGNPGDPKIALKIDTNEIVPGTRWHGLRKISLENGDDKDVATEGIAWQIEKLAADAAGTAVDFTPGLASWVTLTVNGTDYGIYINVEQRDKSYLQNRGIWDAAHTWISIRSAPELVQAPGELGESSPTTSWRCATRRSSRPSRAPRRTTPRSRRSSTRWSTWTPC